MSLEGHVEGVGGRARVYACRKSRAEGSSVLPKAGLLVAAVKLLAGREKAESGEASLRQSGSAFGAAGFGTRERVPFRLLSMNGRVDRVNEKVNRKID